MNQTQQQFGESGFRKASATSDKGGAYNLRNASTHENEKSKIERWGLVARIICFSCSFRFSCCMLSNSIPFSVRSNQDINTYIQLCGFRQIGHHAQYKAR